MASTKSLVSLASRTTLILVLVTLAVAQAQARAQTCSSQLSGLATCASFATPGASSPSQECCGALEAIDHACLCNAFRVATQLPSQCNLPALSCSAN